MKEATVAFVKAVLEKAPNKEMGVAELLKETEAQIRAMVGNPPTGMTIAEVKRPGAPKAKRFIKLG
jgi:hypothetical protein